MAKVPPRKRPRMSDYETPEGRNYLTYLYRDLFCTDEQAAEKIGITRRTLYNWRKKSKVIDQAIAVGKSTVDTMVENSLLQQALKGNVEACKYWLNNRKRDKWRPVWQNDKEEQKQKQQNSQEQSKAIAEMINNPRAERILQDYLDPEQPEQSDQKNNNSEDKAEGVGVENE